MTASFARLATATASTKRNPAAAGGKVGVPVAKLASINIVPPMPVSSEIAAYYRLQSPREAFVSYTEGTPDLLEGDILTTGAVDYRVVAAGLWPANQSYTEIVIQQVKGT